MDEVGLASAFIAASMGQAQLAVAGKMLKMNADAAQSVVQLLDAAEQNLARLANLAAGTGGNLDISV